MVDDAGLHGATCGQEEAASIGLVIGPLGVSVAQGRPQRRKGRDVAAVAAQLPFASPVGRLHGPADRLDRGRVALGNEDAGARELACFVWGMMTGNIA